MNILNIKIFNNSDITGVLNMTKETSYAYATIGIEYNQDINHVEEVLLNELPALKEKNRKIVEGPTYVGISDLGERRYNITIYAGCSESDIYSVRQFLNKELLEILYRNGIKNKSAATPQTPQ